MENKCVSIFYAELNKKLSSWSKSEDDFLPSFDSALTDHQVHLGFECWRIRLAQHKPVRFSFSFFLWLQ